MVINQVPRVQCVSEIKLTAFEEVARVTRQLGEVQVTFCFQG
jgi:hypothetical protein